MAAQENLIFVLDDDPSVRRGLGRLLRAAGHEVEVFASGAELLAVARERLPTCVISDLVMPGMDGIAFRGRLREVSPDTPVIFVTAYDSVVVRERARECGAAGYFRKPVDGDALLQAVAEAVDAPPSGRGAGVARGKHERGAGRSLDSG